MIRKLSHNENPRKGQQDKLNIITNMLTNITTTTKRKKNEQIRTQTMEIKQRETETEENGKHVITLKEERE